jgi:meso-butanediol dehydrogenase/(S,S)-butanediol dehydrogenase/diacetyl reductase
LAGRSAIVTGGAGGIGSCIVRRLVQEGACVCAVDLDATQLAGLQSELGDALRVATGDVSDPALVEHVVAHAEPAATILVNGAARRTFRSVLDLDAELMQAHFALNVVAPAMWVRSFAARVVEEGVPASIVNITSIVAHRGFASNAAYSASKAALLGYSRCAAIDLAPHGIRVNCVAPGPTRTPLTAELFSNPETLAALEARVPLGRIGEPEDVAGAVAFLLSDDSSFLTGATVPVEGGYLVG